MNFYFYRRRLERLKAGVFRTLEPEDMVEEIAFIESMEREIISGLCRLDDDNSDAFSFRRYRKELAKTGIEQKRMTRINDGLNDYRKAINTPKVKLRNQYIGHRTEPTSDAYLTPEEFFPLVEMATGLMDLLSGKREGFVLEAKGAADIDLRKRLGM